MDELFTRIFHGEGFIGRALESIADVAHNTIKEDQIKVAFEVSIGKLVGFLLALDLEHVFDVVKISQGAKFQKAGAGLDLLGKILKHIEHSWSEAINGLRLRLEFVDNILKRVEKLLLTLDRCVAEVDQPSSESAKCYSMYLFLVDKPSNLYEEIVLHLSL